MSDNEWLRALKNNEVPPPVEKKKSKNKKVRTSPNQLLAIRRQYEKS